MLKVNLMGTVAWSSILNTKEVAKVVGRSPRTIRRYAQMGRTLGVFKDVKKGWQFATAVHFTF
jgi:hypothetical protein